MIKKSICFKAHSSKAFSKFWELCITTAQLENAPVPLKGSLVPTSSRGFSLPPVLHSCQAAFSLSIALPVPQGSGR